MIATELAPGDTLDGFCVVSRLHAGGMAVIYEVVHESLPGPAVMKIPRLGQGESSATIVSFEVEQMMLEALAGGPVPMLYASSDVEREPYLVMEKVHGQALNEEGEHAPLAPERVCQIGAAVADALAALHSMEAVHLDIKPSNVMLRPQGDAVLIDLGLAHHAHLPDLLAEAFQRPLGSAPYIAPEQVVGVRSDSRSDLFALGVMLYEFATGKLPFGTGNSHRAMRGRLTVAPTPPRALRPELPPALQEIILHCLEVDPARRYANAQQLAFDLRHSSQVTLTERGRQTSGAGLRQRVQHWLSGAGYEPQHLTRPTRTVAQAPIVLIAQPTVLSSDREQQALRREVEEAARASPQARLAFVTVGKPAPVLGTSDEATSAPREHLRLLAELKHWASGVEASAERVTCQVLEDHDPAEAILQYARQNHVHRILIGVPQHASGRRNALPALVGRIAQEAPCSVTIVRVSS